MRIDWKGKRTFEAESESGERFLFDAPTASGGSGNGPSPLEAFIASIAACSGMDVLMILEKKRQKVTSYRLEVETTRSQEGIYPRPFTTIHLNHIVAGTDLDPQAVDHAVKLSDEKYCSAVATLRANTEITTGFEIREPAEKSA
ncbi:MAG: OsmC family protein [Fimbriimonadaceae bacterium]|nr:OsmC family protein [Fimbriimonadaceae bacterium]